jgi:hypothetical protein
MLRYRIAGDALSRKRRNQGFSFGLSSGVHIGFALQIHDDWFCRVAHAITSSLIQS